MLAFALQAVVSQINCGGPAIPPFLADQPYDASTHAGYIGGSTQALNIPVGGPSDPNGQVHRSARLGWRTYAFDVPNGSYVVRLHFAEIDSAVQGPDQRKFDVNVEGTPVLVDLDVAARIGTQYATEFVTRAVVTDGRLDVDSPQGKDPSTLSAIEVWAWPADLTAPAAVSGLAAKPGVRRNILTWTPSAEADVAGYVVYRSDAPGGPFSAIAQTWATPPRYFDASAPPGAARFYRVAAIDAFGNEGAPSAEVSATALDLGDSPLPAYELTIDPANLKILNTKLFSDPKLTVPAVFSYGGKSWNTEVRYRGANSRRYSKKSWKVKFPSNQPFEGRTRLNLKAHFEDFSMVRQPLAAVVFQGVEHLVADARPVRLLVNGTDAGVFDETENVDEHFLAAHGRNAGGSLYDCDANLAPMPADEVSTYYEKETNEELGYGDLISFLNIVNATPASVFDRVLVSRFDVESYLTYLAVVGWLGDADSVIHNFFLLHDLDLQRWELLPWDNDLGFGLSPFSLAPKADYSIDFGTIGSVDTPLLGWNALKTRVLDVPAFRWRYCEKLKALMPESLDAAIDAAHAAIAAEAPRDTAKWGWESDDLFLGGPAILKTYTPARAAFLATAIAAYEPATAPSAIRINELLVETAPWVTAPWVELYNATAMPVDASLMALTDRADGSGTVWRLPAGSVIAPLGYLQVFVDGQSNLGPLHASFSLAPKGGQLALLDPDGATLRDFVAFAPQLPGVAYGRTADGGPFFARLPTPTPGAANVTTGNLPPSITWVQAVPASPPAGEAVTVSCKATDASGLAAVTLRWSKNGGALASTAMAPVGVDRYEAVIPGQPSGTLVDLFVEALDALGKSAASASQSVQWVSPSAGLVRVNELLADNVSSHTDEAGDHDDWVELANTTIQPADVSGMYLTDDPAKPKKWKIPAGTVIPPLGRLLVWADEEATEGAFHAAFKLSKAGEFIGLYDTDAHLNGLLDGFAFGPQQTDVSLGLEPDGGAPAFLPPIRVRILDPTPGTSNTPPPGGHVRFDSETPGKNTGTLDTADAPQLGQVMSFSLTGKPPGAAVYLLLGSATFSFDLGLDGLLLIYPELYVTAVTGGDGTATIPLLIPANPAFANLTFYAQAFVVPGGLSSALAATILP